MIWRASQRRFCGERAELLKPLLKQRLWDPQARWFRFEDGKGKAELRYTVQMFKPIGSGVLDQECEEGLLSHLNEDEFLSAYGLHSISKRDPAYDQLDIDNGGGGICTTFPPQIIERLYQAGTTEAGRGHPAPPLVVGGYDALLGRLHRRQLQGLPPRHPAPVRLRRRRRRAVRHLRRVRRERAARWRRGGKAEPLPFASRLALKGLKIRGRSLDVHVDKAHFEVRSHLQATRAAIGAAVVVSAKDGSLRLAALREDHQHSSGNP